MKNIVVVSVTLLAFLQCQFSKTETVIDAECVTSETQKMDDKASVVSSIEIFSSIEICQQMHHHKLEI